MASTKELEQVAADPLATDEQRAQAQALLSKAKATQSDDATDRMLAHLHDDYRKRLKRIIAGTQTSTIETPESARVELADFDRRMELKK
jgi:hypothetical protein